jgi:hypothetical protein
MKLPKSLIEKELAKREKEKISPLELLDPNFPQQNAFIADPARLKALFCTRRAAKSFTAGLYLVKTALENPGVNCMFIGLTRASAEGILWKDILKVLNYKHKLKIRFKETVLTATFPNGSVIWLAGVDTDEDEMNKILGRKFKLICIDEASMYSIDTNKLVYGILKPATADYRGTICMMGTSSNITRGLFFDITTGKEPGWSLHTWTAHNNPHVAAQWQEELDDIKTNRPLFMETPLFKQWYLNQWVIDLDKLVYKFDHKKNTYDVLPQFSKNDWVYVLGVDLGYEDDSSFVVAAFHGHDPILYIIDSFKAQKMDITDVAIKIKEFKKRYDITKVIIDGANKQAVEEIQKRHQIVLETAEKAGKADFIEIMNSEFIQEKIKVNPAKNSELINEWMGLIWKTKADKLVLPKVENPNCPNHLSDACLYAWRYCFNYYGSKPIEKPKKGTAEYYKNLTDSLEEAAMEFFTREEEEQEKVRKFWGEE